MTTLCKFDSRLQVLPAQWDGRFARTLVRIHRNFILDVMYKQTLNDAGGVFDQLVGMGSCDVLMYVQRMLELQDPI